MTNGLHMSDWLNLPDQTWTHVYKKSRSNRVMLPEEVLDSDKKFCWLSLNQIQHKDIMWNVKSVFLYWR